MMGLSVQTFVLGAIENNTYLIFSPEANEAVLVDPAVPSRQVVEFLEENQLKLKAIYITHAHFDHIGGVSWFIQQTGEKIDVYLHKDAVELWENSGSARDFGFDFDSGPVPNKILEGKEILNFSGTVIHVLHTPGHTPGHVTFYIPALGSAFCGDLIFHRGVGRTDLPNGSAEQLLGSIQDKIFTLPDNTILYPGHGPSTTVIDEKNNNPYI